MEFKLNINPPTVTAQEHKVRVAGGRPRFYDTAKLKAQALIEKISKSSENRGKYRDELKGLLCQLYGYNEFLMDEMTMLIPPQEWLDFCDANEHPRPVVIRTNTLRTRAKELERTLKTMTSK